MTDIFTIANYFLTKEAMTHKKLQKLCYYAQAWFLANYHTPLIPNRFEAWVHGPVSPDLYTKYHDFGWTIIPKSTIIPNLPTNIVTFLEQIWSIYGSYTDQELEHFTKQESPWLTARKDTSPSYPFCRNPIFWNNMELYYATRLKTKK